MSLLGTQVYANPDTPCWVSTAGGTIDGNLTVTGNLIVDQNLSADMAYVQQLNCVDSAGVTHARFVAVDNTNTYIQTNGTIQFTKIGFGAGNSTFALSALGANTDLLTVGGQILTAPGGGVTPATVSYPGATSITLGAAPTTLAPTTAFTVTSGQEYDIQVTGVWAVSAGVTTPAAGDYVSILARTGTGTSPIFYQFQAEDVQYPADVNNVWTSASFHPFKIRARLQCNVTGPLALIAEAGGPGTYPGNLVQIQIQNCDIVRVR